MCVLPALILPRIADAAIQHSLIVEVEVGAVARASAEFPALKPSAFGKVFGAYRGIHASIDGPVHGFASNLSFGRRVAETRNHQSALALFFLNRMRHNWKIEHWHAHQPD